MRVEYVKAFEDNYVYILSNETSNEAAIVDPGQALSSLDFISKNHLLLKHLLITHHHFDHTKGIAEILAQYPGLPVLGGAEKGRIKHQTSELRDGEELTICGFRCLILEIPGHTLGHLAFYFPESHDLFTGDTIFGATCGNISEGTPENMWKSLTKIRDLPPQTKIWCAHEYTRHYIDDALTMEPWNKRLVARKNELRHLGAATIPLLLEEEVETNPFLHWDHPEVARRHGTTDPLATFKAIIGT